MQNCLYIIKALSYIFSIGYSYYTSWASSRVQVSFKQSEYTVKESDGRVAIAIQATRGYVYDSFYVKIRASVNRALGYHYGVHLLTMYTHCTLLHNNQFSIDGFEGFRGQGVTYFLPLKQRYNI